MGISKHRLSPLVKPLTNIARCVILIVYLCAGCSNQIETPSQFTKEFVSALQQADPNLKVTIVRDLELQINFPNQKEPFTSFLDNPYDSYKKSPKLKAGIIAQYVKANLETSTVTNEPIDRNRVVPVIKDRPWLSEVNKTLSNRGNKKPLDVVYEELNADLLIVYAQDSKENMRFLTPKDLVNANIKREELRALACTNLAGILPKIECEGTNGLYMITAGGDYEASLLLLDDLWTNLQTKVQGDVVVAVPCRELVLMTGTKVPNGPAYLKRLLQKAYDGSTYRISDKLFVRQNGSFKELK